MKIFFILLISLILFAKVNHPIDIPNYDDFDENINYSLNLSAANFFKNPSSLSARPDGSGTAFNRYNADLCFDSKFFAIEGDFGILTDKEMTHSITAFSEMDKDLVLTYHHSDIIDFYIENEHESPYDHSLLKSYYGIGSNYTYTNNEILNNELDILFDFEKVIKNTNYSARPDGTGLTNTIYTMHINYDLPLAFSLSIEETGYTDKNKYFKLSELDQVYQLNYQINNDIIISLFRENDKFMDINLPSQTFSGLQLLYEF